ncbi:MAG: hybrid sensor histidine kinase/response regulator [Erythrobacter sp.]|nr:hybrid sensor histidine kinase/response regulator [Erythrobacter sp.]
MTESFELTSDQLGQIVEDALNEIYLFCAADFRFVMVNRGARENLGFSIEDIRRLTPWDIMPEFSRKEFLKLIEPLVTGETASLDFRTVHERRDGTRYDASIRLQLMQRDCMPVYFAAAQDISELRQAQETLRDSARRLDAILSNTAMAVFMLDERQHCVFMNYAAEQMTGFTLPEMQGKPFHDVVHHTRPDGRHFPIEECEIARGYPENYRTQVEEVFVHKDGSFYPVGFTASAVKNEGDETIGTVIEARNIEAEIEARKIEEQLREAQKLEAIGHLTGGIAHDFNNLLMIILGNAEILSESLNDPDLRSLVETTLGAAERAAGLTDRLLSFARRRPLDPKPLQVNDLLEGMRDLIRTTLPENIEFEFVPNPILDLIEVDAVEFETAILNLAANARDAMTHGGKFTIEVNSILLDETYTSIHFDVVSGEYVEVIVNDTGEGMDPDTLQRVFEPFFTTKKVGKGTGLGLSMVFGFVKQSGGHIRIYSEPGVGTSIKLYFPACREKELPQNLKVEWDIPTGTENILVVEDDEQVLAYIEAQLSSLGYHVSTAMSGPEALVVLEEQGNSDLLLTDVIMPGGMNGRQLADRAREKYPSLKILYSSGYSSNVLLGNGRLDSDMELLSKPYSRKALAAKVRAVLDKDVGKPT